MELLETARTFGAYFFKPITASKLRAAGFSDRFINSLRFSEDPARPLYLMGIAVNAIVHPGSNNKVLALCSIDDCSSEYAVPTSLVFSLKRDYDTDGNLSAVREDSTDVLVSLIKTAGIAFKLQPSPGITAEEISARVREALSVVSAPRKKALSREEIVELLKTERECVIRSSTCNHKCSECVLSRDADKLVAMYDYVIKTYGTLQKQNKACKYVRMADGSRKFVPNEKAAKLLKLPVSQRK